LNWLDIGCGTGALTAAICDMADPSLVVGCDPSAAFVEHSSKSINHSRATFVQGSDDNLPRHNGGFDRIVSGLVMNFLPDPRVSLQNLRSNLQPGGEIAGYVWDYADGMQFLRVFWDEVVALDPDAKRLDEGFRFTICQPEALENLFRDSGLRDVKTGSIEIPTTFSSFSDFWQPFLGGTGTGPAPSYVVSLDDGKREELRSRLERNLPVNDDGSIPLSARA
jgi:SAM-dependent methyltransferase